MDGVEPVTRGQRIVTYILAALLGANSAFVLTDPMLPISWVAITICFFVITFRERELGGEQ